MSPRPDFMALALRLVHPDVHYFHSLTGCSACSRVSAGLERQWEAGYEQGCKIAVTRPSNYEEAK